VRTAEKSRRRNAAVMSQMRKQLKRHAGGAEAAMPSPPPTPDWIARPGRLIPKRRAHGSSPEPLAPRPAIS